jgi:hypothetical protein
MKKNEVILHGECMIFQSSIPSSAKQLNKSKTGYVIVADSETTGNHHVVDEIEGVDFFQDTDGKLFMKNLVETTVRCLHKERHDTIRLPAGTYEFGSQQEYDPFTARLQNVRD